LLRVSRFHTGSGRPRSGLGFGNGRRANIGHAALAEVRRRHPKVENAYRNWRRKSREKRLEVIRRARAFRRGIEEKVEKVEESFRKSSG